MGKKAFRQAVFLTTVYVLLLPFFFALGDEVKSKLASLEEWRIRWGQRVVIENANIRTPTDFIIDRGGTLVIRNSEICMLGKHHHDNYIRVNGQLVIENSILTADPPAAYINIATESPRARIEIRDSQLPDAHVSLKGGGVIELQNTTVNGLEFYQTQQAMREGGRLVATHCVVEKEFDLRFGDTTGTFTIKGLRQGISDYSFRAGQMSIDIEDCILPIPIVDNRGSGGLGRLRLHIVDCELSGAVSWEGGDLIVEDSTLCALGIRHYYRGPYEYRGLRPGYFQDKVLVDQPNRTIRLINTTILDCWESGSRNRCPEEASVGICLVDVDGAVIENSKLCELKVRGDLIAKDVKIGGLQLYENTGTLRFEDCVIESFEVVISTNSHIYGNVRFLTDEIFDWGGWTEFSVTRHYPILVVTQEGIPLPDTTIEIINPDGEVEAKLVTDELGMAEAVIHFTEATCTSVWQVRVPSLGISLPVTLLSDTPIRTDRPQLESPSSVWLRKDLAVDSTPFLTWTPKMIISANSGDVPGDPRCDIVALYTHEKEDTLYVRVEFRGDGIDTEGREFRYEIYLSSPEWGNIGYKLVLDKRMMWKCLDWDAVESYPTEWRVHGNAIEVAIPIDLLPPFTRMQIGAQTRIFPDITMDYVDGTFER